MKIIQYILVILCLIPIGIMKYGGKASGRASYRAGFIIFVCLFLTAVLFPELVMYVANTLGVGRGTDLLVYMTTFALICFSLIMIVKFERLQRELTALVRKLTLENSKDPNSSE